MALSTDKAAAPINLYGATKLASDKIFVASNHYSLGEGAQRRTRFAVSRYGNVMGSRGSVIPLFLRLLQEQREAAAAAAMGSGESDRNTDRDGVRYRLPVTDARMTRFWMTLEQSVNFVLSNLALMRGGEIFVPKIEKTTIVGLAKALGGPGTAIDEIGIRPGEKLHEALLTEHQQPATVELADRFVICPILDWWERAGVQRVYTDALGATAVAEGYTYTSKSAPAMAAGDVRALLERDRVQGNNALPAWDESTL